MSGQKPEALRLTDWYDEDEGFCQGTKAPHKWVLQANSELRRLHEVNAELVEALKKISMGGDPRWADDALTKATGEQQ